MVIRQFWCRQLENEFLRRAAPKLWRKFSQHDGVSGHGLGSGDGRGVSAVPVIGLLVPRLSCRPLANPVCQRNYDRPHLTARRVNASAGDSAPS